MIRSYALLLLCVTLWGSNFVFGTILTLEFPPLVLSSLRLFVSFVFLYFYALSTRRLDRLTVRQWLPFVALGLFGTALNQYAFFTGLTMTDPTNASLILSLAPITTALLASWFLKEAFTKRMAFGSLVALAGVATVVVKGGSVQLSAGDMLMVLAMITFSFSMVYSRHLCKTIDPVSVSLFGTLWGLLFIAPAAFTIHPAVNWNVPWWVWLLIVLTAVVFQGVCGIIWNRQLLVVGAGTAAIFLNLQPFSTMVFSFALLGRPVTVMQIIGAIIIIAGVTIAVTHNTEGPSRIAGVRHTT